jgi:hypothetical protein
MVPIFWATALGASVKPKVQMMAIITATVSAPAKLPAEDQPPVAQDAAHGDARALVDQGQRAQREDAGQQIEAEQVEQDEADREEHGANQRLAGLHGDRDREGGGERQDGAGHVGADQRIAGGHEDFRFTGIDHLGDEFGGCQVGHGGFLFGFDFI